MEAMGHESTRSKGLWELVKPGPEPDLKGLWELVKPGPEPDLKAGLRAVFSADDPDEIKAERALARALLTASPPRPIPLAVTIEQRSEPAPDPALHAPPLPQTKEEPAGGEQIKCAKTYYRGLLDKDLTHWRKQATAAEHIATEFLKLPKTSWQIALRRVVRPVLDERGLRRKIRKKSE